jgi:nitrogen fixation/metabolism regulation signal transduction histidine kinase
MLPEISLNILDVAQNALRAKATKVEICVEADMKSDLLQIWIRDNGSGMTTKQVEQVADPFFTTRTTRKVGLGISFFREAALATGGDFHIESEVEKGTLVQASFILSHIDRMPLGNMVDTIYTLILMHQEVEWIYTYQVDKRKFTLDTKEFKKILGDVPFETPEVSKYIKEFLKTNMEEINGNIVL